MGNPPTMAGFLFLFINMNIRGIIRSILKEELEVPMVNTKEVYFQAGMNAGMAMRRNNQSGYQRQKQWLSKALSMETDANRSIAQSEFDRGYYEANPKRDHEYFREQNNETSEYPRISYLKKNTEFRYGLGNIKSTSFSSGTRCIRADNLPNDEHGRPSYWVSPTEKNHDEELASWMNNYGFHVSFEEVTPFRISLRENASRVKGGDKPMRWGNGEIASLNDRLESGYAVAKFTSTENAVRYSRSKWNKMGWDEQKKYAAQMNRKVIKYNVQFKDESFVSVPKAMYDQIRLTELPEKNFYQQY